METSIQAELKVNHIRSAMAEQIQNISPNSQLNRDTLFYADAVEEETSSYVLPYDQPLPTRNINMIDEVGVKQIAVNFSLQSITQSVTWKVEDDLFNKSPKKIITQAKQAGQHFLNLPEYMLVEYLSNAVGAQTRYYSKVEACWDGKHLIDNTAGRLGLSTGNKFGGTSQTAQGYFTDVKRSINAFASMTNPRNGNLAWSLDENSRFLILGHGSLTGEFLELIQSKFLGWVIENVAGTDNVAGTRKDNVFGRMIQYKALNQLSGTNKIWIVTSNLANNPGRTPFLHLTKSEYNPYVETPFISPLDYALVMSKKRAVVFETYQTVAPSSPFSIIEIEY